MLSIICKEPYQFQLEERARPVRRFGEALIRMKAVGVCGTDYHAYRGRQPYFVYPRILGHEIAAVVVETDDHADGIQPGDSVTVIPYISCGCCVACRRGKPNACIHLKVIGVHTDGAMREYLSVPYDRLLNTNALTLEQTVIVEPLAIGAHAVRRGQISKGEHVLVIGAGPIGLAVMKFAALSGAKVMALDVNTQRLEFCKKWAGVDAVSEASGEEERALLDWTGGDLPTTVIDATGNAASMMKAFSLVGYGGKLVYVSLVQDHIRFNHDVFCEKELTVSGSRAATREDFQMVMDAFHRNVIDANLWITHRAQVKDAIPAFERWLQPESAVIKALIEF